ncbi:MAG: nicotinate (nicotinamide) nucleotide adenylyltransferase [Candidatus Obscuribacter sp.]|jgi:nicotinate-nucleotide adenylyltransferase|nr:nicotinate (nicotinamide) nucleotide adenylyltransferase [Candidatus Obscuribacter sp.]MBK9770946.1 nicotinate (nicotinamide) nucleotide adenylyltransferase [Candidatus Obscuribacter sp.]
MSKIKIGLLGGTFDPVHNGHLYVAQFLRQKLNLDQVYLVTAGSPPHKVANVLGAEHRHNMVEVACQGVDGVVASSVELDNGFSYTIDTIRHLRQHHPAGEDNIELTFITSSEYVDPDNPHHILTWKEAAQLLSLVKLVVTPRGSQDAATTANWAQALGLDSVEVVDLPPMHVTSLMVKNALREGHSLEGMVPEAIARLIKSRGYYR